MASTSFLKKFDPAKFFFFSSLGRSPKQFAGIDIGTFSTKVVQLRYEKERAILETYGELLNKEYFKGNFSNFLHFSDGETADLLRDLLRESNVTANNLILSIPASSSFITVISLPPVPDKELREAVPFEARRYVPIPISEVVLDWEILGQNDARDRTDILLLAVPKEVIEKFRRICGLLEKNLQSLEVESFSMARSLALNDLTPTVFINFGHQTTTLAVTDRGRLRLSHSLNHGSNELTKVLERGLNISEERAESLKREAGISEKIEEKEITSIITPLVEAAFSEIERYVSIYNRKAPRTIQKINLTGGGSNLKGIVEYAVGKFGIEVARSNPFSRIVSPAFMQPVLREIGPSFSVAAGLALQALTPR